jgi:threonine/homoserine/homoserine lactone efflux protein
MLLFLKGFAIGLMVAVPVGPIGLLCVNRALFKGAAYGLLSGLGVATADAIAAGIAVLGLTLVSGFLLEHQLWLRLIGGFFLCYLGVKIFSTTPMERAASAKDRSLVSAYVSTFLLTSSNPLTILSFVAIYAGWGIEELSGRYFAALELTAGVFTGSAAWWFGLCGGMPAFRLMFSHQGLEWIHKVSGALIAGFGFVVLLSLLQRAVG